MLKILNENYLDNVMMKMLKLFHSIPKHLSFAQGVVEKIKNNAVSSAYSHNNILKVNESASPTYEVDCSGFVRYVLNSSGYDAAVSELLQYTVEVKKIQYLQRIYTYDFFDFFIDMEIGKIKSTNWQVVNPHMRMKPGDILVWIGNSNTSTHTTFGQSGHIVLIDNIISTNEDKITARLIDSNTKHYNNDTRGSGDTGIGAGEVSFFLDGKGDFTKIRASENSQEILPVGIKIGRLKPFSK